MLKAIVRSIGVTMRRRSTRSKQAQPAHMIHDHSWRNRAVASETRASEIPTPEDEQLRRNSERSNTRSGNDRDTMRLLYPTLLDSTTQQRLCPAPKVPAGSISIGRRWQRRSATPSRRYTGGLKDSTTCSLGISRQRGQERPECSSDFGKSSKVRSDHKIESCDCAPVIQI